jgi:hypothetical protein
MADDIARARRREEFVSLLDRSIEACRRQGDEEGEYEMEFAREVLLAAIAVADRWLSRGDPPHQVLGRLARGFGIPIAASVIVLTLPGRSEAGVDVVVPALKDIASAFAATQDRRALEAEQGRLFS